MVCVRRLLLRVGQSRAVVGCAVAVHDIEDCPSTSDETGSLCETSRATLGNPVTRHTPMFSVTVTPPFARVCHSGHRLHTSICTCCVRNEHSTTSWYLSCSKHQARCMLIDWGFPDALCSEFDLRQTQAQTAIRVHRRAGINCRGHLPPKGQASSRISI